MVARHDGSSASVWVWPGKLSAPVSIAGAGSPAISATATPGGPSRLARNVAYAAGSVS
jgi:hypothetical protein